MNLVQFCEKIHLDNNVIDEIYRYHISDEDYWNYKRMFYDNKQIFYQTVLRESAPYKLFLVLYIKFAMDAFEEYQKRNINLQIYFDTFSDITIWSGKYFSKHGEYGLDEYDWLSYHIELKLFRLSRLQFQPKPLPLTVIYNNKIFHEGVLAFNVHIPEGDALDRTGVLSAYQQATDFFNCPSPVFICESWLLSPALKDILKPSSNILQFQMDYYIYAVDEISRQAEERIFGCLENNPEWYPEQTSLQLHTKKHLMGGSKIPVGFGIKV